MIPYIEFGECLKLLLSALDISNNRLSKAINVDSSLVNRWIHGKRVPPYNSGYVESISEYLSNHVHNTLQEQNINTILLNAGMDEEGFEDIKEKIKKILLEAQGYSIECNKRKRIEIKNNSVIKDQKTNIEQLNHREVNNAPFLALSSEDKVVLGSDNILTAYDNLLEAAANLESRKCDTIYISYNDLIYAEHLSHCDIKKWRDTLLKVINNGWNVILLLRLNANIVRSIRFLNYMISLVQTGSFMPYYIKNYDSMTIGDDLVVVPDIGVISCFSNNRNPHISGGLYIKSKPAIRIYQNHFQGLIEKYALPLVNTFSNRIDYSHYLADSEDDIGNRFLYKYCFSVLTLPEHLYWKFLGRRKHSNVSKLTSMGLYRKRLQAFLSNIQNYEYKDVYIASSIKDLMKHQQFYLYSYEGIEAIYMDTHDIIEYLENIIKLLQEYDNYKIAFLPKDFNNTENMESFCCVVKERTTVLFESSNQITSTQDIHTSITEPTLVKAIYDYFIELWEHIPPAYKEKSEVISWLQNQIIILRS